MITPNKSLFLIISFTIFTITSLTNTTNITNITTSDSGSEIKFLGKINTYNSTDVKLTSRIANDLVLPGMGYSSDLQKQASTQCYNFISKTKTNQKAIIQYEQSINYDNLLNEFNIESSLGVGYGAFTASAEINYLNSVKDTKYRISLNYFQKIVTTVSFTYSYNKDTILNETGMSIYDDGKNPMFRLFCGDRLIKSYEKGAGLIFSLVLRFNSEEQKKVFENNNTLGFGPFATISAKIKKTTAKQKIQGTVRVDAFQFGGKPIELSKILSSAIAVCDINKIEECQNTIKQLIEYASKDFPAQFENLNQIKEEDNSLLVNTGKFEKDFYVSDFGLILASTYVTDQVKVVRKDLTRNYKKMNYYLTNLKILRLEFNNSNINFNDLIKATESLINNLNEGIDLYNYPHRATEIYQNILEKTNLKGIENELIETFESIKYYVKYDDAFKTEIFPLGNKKFECKQTTQLFYQIFCNAKDFTSFDLRIESDLNISFSFVAKGETQYNAAKDNYSGKIISPDITLNITGKRVENKFFVKTYEDVEKND